MDVQVLGDLESREVDGYIAYAKQQHPNRRIAQLIIEADGDYINLSYQFEPVPFERIRRITGYLVGTVDRFNDAKRAELNDRVKHSL